MPHTLKDGHELTKFESFVLQYIDGQHSLGKKVKEREIIKKFELDRVKDKDLKEKVQNQLNYIFNSNLVIQQGRVYIMSSEGIDLLRELNRTSYPRFDNYIPTRVVDYL